MTICSTTTTTTAPGPALLFVIVNGIPSQGIWIMVGNSIIGTQPTSTPEELPENTMPDNPSWTRRKKRGEVKRGMGRWKRERND